jgi:hypothetical protein
MLSKSTIMARPGWSALNFDRLLGEPDHTTRIKHVIVKLYTEDRVRQVEASELFQNIKQKYAVRKFSARKSFVLANNEFAKTLNDVIEVAEVLPIGSPRVLLDTTMLGALTILQRATMISGF